MYGKAKVDYTDLKLDAATIKYDQRAQMVQAYGSKDSSGNPSSKPQFIQGEMKSISDTIFYNMKSGKGLTKNTFFQEGEIYVNAIDLKKISSTEVYAKRARFTTCNLDVPHYNFRTSKMKIINNKMGIAGPSFPEFEAGAFGVDIFFAISGFVMYSTTSATNTSAQKFLRDRAIRILPLYWLITILLGISALVIPSLFNNFEVHPTQIVESLLFIPFYNEDGNIRPILSMGWTLHYEVAFYLVTACCIAVNINKQNKALTAAVFITLLSIAISSFNAELKFSFLQLVAPLSIEFLFGATTAFIFTRYGQLISEGKSRILFALGCLGISSALLATNNEAEIGIGFPRLMHWGIPGALILISDDISPVTLPLVGRDKIHV